MKRRQVFSWLCCAFAVSGLSAQQGTDPAISGALLAKYKPTRAEFQFGLIGDQQYNAQQEAQFPAVLRAMDREPLAFVAHDGDIKGGQRCTDELLRDRLELFQSSQHPFIYTPGDNDWTDCHEAGMGGYDPLERLARLRQLFYADAGQSLGKRKLFLTSQSEQRQFQLFRENLLWTTGEVVFATLHTVGSNNGLGRNPEGDAEFQARNEANLTWLRTAFALARDGRFQALMLITQANPRFEFPPADPRRTGFAELVAVLEQETRAFGKPVVLVHGDTHYFRIDKPLPYVEGPRVSTVPPLLKNFTRVETFGPPDLHWIRVRVVPTNPNVFLFEPEVWR
jgi:hypothetical protein